MAKVNKKLVSILYNTNKPKYNLLKAVEELQELSLILTQRINKPTKVMSESICEEIAHVKLRLKVLEKMYPSDLIEKELRKKENYLFEKFKNGEYRKKL